MLKGVVVKLASAECEQGLHGSRWLKTFVSIVVEQVQVEIF